MVVGLLNKELQLFSRLPATSRQFNRPSLASKNYQIPLLNLLMARTLRPRLLTASSASVLVLTYLQTSSRGMVLPASPIFRADSFPSLINAACKGISGEPDSSFDKKLTDKDADPKYQNEFNGIQLTSYGSVMISQAVVLRSIASRSFHGLSMALRASVSFQLSHTVLLPKLMPFIRYTRFS